MKLISNSPSLEGVDLPKGKDGVVYRKLNLPFNPKLKQRARDLRKSGNLAEVILWIEIKSKKLNGLDFDRQKIIGNYIVDFYCHTNRLIIEIDGSSHDQKEGYDAQRDIYFLGLGLKILHFTDLEVKNNLDEVLEQIKRT